MPQIYWKKREPLDSDNPDEHQHNPSYPVDEQNAFPVGIFFRESDTSEAEQVTVSNPLPVKNSPHWRISVPQIPVSVSLTVMTLIAPANPNRISIMITNETGSSAIRVGTSPSAQQPAAFTVTAGPSQYLHSAQGSNVTMYGNNAIWGLSVTTAAQTVSVLEDIEV